MSGDCSPPPVDGDWAGHMLSLRRRGRGIRNPSRSFGLPADKGNAAAEGGSVAWWHLVARVARVISYGSKGGANVCVGC